MRGKSGESEVELGTGAGVGAAVDPAAEKQLNSAETNKKHFELALTKAFTPKDGDEHKFSAKQIETLVGQIVSSPGTATLWENQSTKRKTFEDMGKHVAEIVKSEASDKLRLDEQIIRLAYEAEKECCKQSNQQPSDLSATVIAERKSLFKAILTDRLTGGGIESKTPEKHFSDKDTKTLVDMIADHGDKQKLYESDASKADYKKRADIAGAEIKKEANADLTSAQQINSLGEKGINAILAYEAAKVKKAAQPVAEKDEREQQLRNTANAKADAPKKPGLLDNVTKNLTTATGALAGLAVGILLLAVPFAGPFLFFAAIAAGAAYGKHKTNERENAQAEAEATPNEPVKSQRNAQSASPEPGVIQQMKLTIEGLRQENAALKGAHTTQPARDNSPAPTPPPTPVALNAAGFPPATRPPLSVNTKGSVPAAAQLDLPDSSGNPFNSPAPAEKARSKDDSDISPMPKPSLLLHRRQAISSDNPLGSPSAVDSPVPRALNSHASSKDQPSTDPEKLAAVAAQAKDGKGENRFGQKAQPLQPQTPSTGRSH